MSKRIIYWFRNDLRLNDNEAFRNAVSDADDVIPVFVFDPRRFRLRELGFRKTSINRALHIRAGVARLQQQIRERGGNLLIKVGDPEKIVAELARIHEAEEVRASKEITLEETNIEASLSKKLKGINVDISLTWMNTLIHPHDLPFYISRLPERYEDFVKQVRLLPVRKPVTELILNQKSLMQESSNIPDLRELGFSEKEIGNASSIDRSEGYDQRIGTLSAESSVPMILSQISFGLVSPREAYHLTDGMESQKELYSRLLWRDYLLFVVLKYGTRLFKPSGLVHRVDRNWKYDKELFRTWIEGRTKNARVNSYMKSLSETGELQPEGVRVVAGYLVEELGVNWTWGASWFESQLKEYEVALNWGNWNYFAGVGFETIAASDLQLGTPLAT